MKRLSQCLLPALLLTATANAFAASSVDLSVTGLITPSACTPALIGGGAIDYGKISAKDLTADGYTPLGIRTIPFTITCEAKTLIGFRGTDNRAGSDPDGDGRMYGLGIVNDTEKLGDYGLRLNNLTADGESMRVIASSNNGSTWQAFAVMRPNYLMSVADSTTIAPVALQALSGDIDIDAYIAPANGLTLDKELTMDGSATLTVRYL
ncbi:DUF1120 domain-containing protein [Pseudomonas nabeulensis]|uniref:DUF1120 domain-containing protein n=1 Tax=Pseudomonas nabeulensis TaxID=2293833 RepID=A0A4Z0AUZ5_9PSED|nr:DUF1120 domain-containing protein [Pseudomonas nabeulensis]TFY90177.1 DUF1120 domain-containing protein [Pseudomonas nabeulensis]